MNSGSDRRSSPPAQPSLDGLPSLLAQQAFAGCLIENSPSGILVYRESGECLMANQAAAQITGGTLAALLRQNFHEIASWRACGLYRAALDVLQGDSATRVTVHLQTTFGRELSMECCLSVFRMAEERMLLLIVNDVTARVQAERQIRATLDSLVESNRRLDETQHQLLQSEKLASIGQLAAGVAHELNNPIGFVQSNLGTLSGYVDDLLKIDAAWSGVEATLGEAHPQLLAPVRALKSACDHDFLVGDLRQLIVESREGLDRVRKIVQDLKDFSRVGDATWQWADLHQGIDSTLNIVWNELKYKAEVIREFGELPQIRCIPSQLNQVVMNLLVNAAQAIDGRGRIVVRTGREGDRVWFEVADTGRGIPPDVRQRIFEPFFTTKPVGKGTGLGLSLSWGIVQRHGGDIAFVSEVGAGTSFRVTLPIDPPAAQEAQ